MLFVLKLVWSWFSYIKYVIFFSDFTKYNSIFTREEVDYTTAVEMTSELLFIEVAHRIIVCLYEVILQIKITFKITLIISSSTQLMYT